MHNIEDLIDQARERALQIRENEIEWERKKNRPRTLLEAHKVIDCWKKWHHRKKITSVAISIVREYVPQFDQMFYKLRLFIGGKLDTIYNLDTKAGESLTSGLPHVEMGGLDFFRLFDNHK